MTLARKCLQEEDRGQLAARLAAERYVVPESNETPHQGRWGRSTTTQEQPPRRDQQRDRSRSRDGSRYSRHPGDNHDYYGPGRNKGSSYREDASRTSRRAPPENRGGYSSGHTQPDSYWGDCPWDAPPAASSGTTTGAPPNVAAQGGPPPQQQWHQPPQGNYGQGYYPPSAPPQGHSVYGAPQVHTAAPGLSYYNFPPVASATNTLVTALALPSKLGHAYPRTDEWAELIVYFEKCLAQKADIRVDAWPQKLRKSIGVQWRISAPDKYRGTLNTPRTIGRVWTPSN